MACGNFVIAHGNVFNREVTERQAWYFHAAEDVANLIDTLEREGTPEGTSERFQGIVRRKYDWDRICRLYDSVWNDTQAP